MGGDDDLEDMASDLGGAIDFDGQIDWGVDLGMDSGINLPGVRFDSESRSRSSSTSLGQFSASILPPPPPLVPPDDTAEALAASPRFSTSILPPPSSQMPELGAKSKGQAAGSPEAVNDKSSISFAPSKVSLSGSPKKPKTSSKTDAKKTKRKRKRAPSSSDKANGDKRGLDIRLQRNRESAKQYRMRKKAEISFLESNLARLEEQNEALRKQIASAQAQRQMVNVQNNEEFDSRMQKLIDLVNKNVSDEEILQQLYRLRIDYQLDLLA